MNGLIVTGDVNLRQNEEVAFVTVALDVGARDNSEGLRNSWLMTRKISLWLFDLEDRQSLVASLLYAWLTSTRANSIDDALKQFVAECKRHGWISIADVERIVKKAPGPAKGSAQERTRRKLAAWEKSVKSEPLLKEEARLQKVAKALNLSSKGKLRAFRTLLEKYGKIPRAGRSSPRKRVPSKQ